MKFEVVEKMSSPVPVPPLFVCPISLEIMRDPVTLCTGVTYDRDFIGKWLRRGNNVCPVTGQILHSRDLIPNRTLANIIQKWCFNAFEKSDPVAEVYTVRQLIRQIEEEGRNACSRAEAVRKLRNFGKSESNRASILRSECVLPVLVRVLEKFQAAEEEGAREAVQEAVGAIASFPVKDVTTTIDLLSSPPVIRNLVWVLANGKLSSRLNAAGIVEKVANNTDKIAAAMEIGLIDGITDQLLTLIRQNATYVAAIRVCLKALLPLCCAVTNLGKIAEAVDVIIPVLIQASAERRVVIIELSMGVLEALSATWEGRGAIMAHPSCAMPVIVTNLLLVSHVATAHGVKILLNICSSCSKVEDEEVVRQVVKMGAMEKLVALLHMDYAQRTKHSANHLLKILSPLLDNDFCAQFLVPL